MKNCLVISMEISVFVRFAKCRQWNFKWLFQSEYSLSWFTNCIQVQLTCYRIKIISLLQTMKLYLFWNHNQDIKKKTPRFQIIVSFRHCNKTVAYRNHNGFYEWRRVSFVKSRPIIIINDGHFRTRSFEGNKIDAQ